LDCLTRHSTQESVLDKSEPEEIIMAGLALAAVTSSYAGLDPDALHKSLDEVIATFRLINKEVPTPKIQ
jgi:hypothetical protein